MVKKNSPEYDFEETILKNIGLVIFDEAHLYVSKEYKNVYKRLYCKYTIGLTATPYREDKLHKIAEYNIGPIIDSESLDGYETSAVEFNSIVTLIRYRGKDENTTFRIRDDGIIDYQHILEQILNDDDRNQLIINKIFELVYNKESYVFVFSDRRNHLELLYDLLLDKIIDSEFELNVELPELNKSTILYGGASNHTIETAKDISNIILTTYQYSSTGVSINRMSALILATPRKKIETFTQIIGRIFRLGSDLTKTRYIYDIVDYKLPIKNGYKQRMQVYEERNAQIEYEDYYAE